MGLLQPFLELPSSTLVGVGVVSLLAIHILYSLLFHPLRHIPGPFLSRISPLPLYYSSYIGTEATHIHALHEKYGPIVLIAPNSVHIASGSAWPPIYTEKGGFLKPACYENFHIDGFPTIFSAIDPRHRAPRAKAVVPLFSTANLRSGGAAIDESVEKFVTRMEREKSTGRKVNVLNVARALATDAVSGYLFGQSYGGLEEDRSSTASTSKELSASPFVDAFVAVGRFFYLPKPLFLFLEQASTTLFPDPHVDASMAVVDSFIADIVRDAENGNEKQKDSYPSRLLSAGMTAAEVRAQCKDLVFAGTDSTAMNLATICWNLARQPQTWGILRSEVESHNINDPTANIQSLPYLSGVVKEGLRLSMANPTRLPRTVPPGGWSFGGHFFPAGTELGMSAFELHLNPEIFKNPMSFWPERWINPTPEMMRDFIPFGGGSRTCSESPFCFSLA